MWQTTERSASASRSKNSKLTGDKTLGASEFIKDENSSEGSKTYIEFHSDEESQRAAYRRCSRGGKLRSSVEDTDDFFGAMVPHLAKHLFEGDPTDLIEWMELTEEDLETYREEVLESEEDD